LALFAAAALLPKTSPRADAAPPADLVSLLPNGAVDFSDWTAIPAPSSNQVLSTLSFERNEVDYQVTLRAASYEGGPLFANLIVDLSSPSTTHSYAYQYGSASTSWHYWSSASSARRIQNVTDGSVYTRPWRGGTAIAQEFTTTYSGATILVSEIVYITQQGAISHTVTYTNTGATAAEGFNFGVFLDTQLDADDRIPIIKAGPKAVYIENSSLRLYLALLEGDALVAGGYSYFDTLSGFQNVDGSFTPGQTIVQGVDTAVEYQLRDQTVLPGQSVTIAYEERLYAEAELDPALAHVVFVDDEAGGAVVSPLPGSRTQLSGQPLEPIAYAQTEAEAAIPPNYQVASIDAPALFDDDNSTDQAVTVHLNHVHQVSQMTTTRTVTYEGADQWTPPAVTQTQDWVVDTDLLTGQVTYSADSGYAVLPTPAVQGHTPDVAQVAATGPVGASTTQPADTQVTVRYTVQALQAAVAGPATQVEGNSVTLSAAGSINPLAGGLTYAWDLDGDGDFGDWSGVEVTVPLPVAGNYSVSLRVTDMLGRTSQTTWTVEARNVAPQVSAGANQTLAANGLLSRPGSFTDPGSDTWEAWVNYGDGSGRQLLTLQGQEFALEHAYTKAGTYQVSVEVLDLTGNSTGLASFEVVVPSGVSGAGPQGGLPVTGNQTPLGQFVGTAGLTIGLGAAFLVVGRRFRSACRQSR
jgi:hypothetical protein